jgi:hypothetical protein
LQRNGFSAEVKKKPGRKNPVPFGSSDGFISSSPLSSLPKRSSSLFPKSNNVYGSLQQQKLPNLQHHNLPQYSTELANPENIAKTNKTAYLRCPAMS